MAVYPFGKGLRIAVDKLMVLRTEKTEEKNRKK